jgi:hypothetical protein
MKALLLFHIRVGTRVAVRAFAPLFAAVLAGIILQTYPVEMVKSIASRLYSPRPALEDVLLATAFAFIFPAWAVPKLTLGLLGWMRHLPISQIGNRRGMALALGVTQVPLAVSLLLLAAVAHELGLPTGYALMRWCVILAAGAIAAAPARRQLLTSPLCIAAALLTLSSNRWMLLPSIACLVAADAFAGPLRERPRRKPWRAAGSFLSFRIAWRALGWEPIMCYLLSGIPLGATALFISNNGLAGPWAAGSARFGGTLAVLILISGLARRLALRRPPWPLARSFPWSAAHRVGNDALFLGLHALPLIVFVYWLHPSALASLLALTPYLSIRGAGSMRQLPARRTGEGAFIAEGIFVAGSCALLPWAAAGWLAAALPAFYAARRAELHQKVTLWLELHYATVGDSLSWSDG